MNKTLIFAAAPMLGVAALTATSAGGAGATKSDEDGGHKDWICHVVEGQGELMNGYNLIGVDQAAIQSEGHQNHESNDGRRDIIHPRRYDATRDLGRRGCGSSGHHDAHRARAGASTAGAVRLPSRDGHLCMPHLWNVRECNLWGVRCAPGERHDPA